MSDFIPMDRAAGLFRKEQKALGDTQYIFHPLLHEVLSLAFINFDLQILSKEQEILINKYMKNADALDAGTYIDAELEQLDEFLGSLTNELHN